MANRLISFNKLGQRITGVADLTGDSKIAADDFIEDISARMERAIIGYNLSGEIVDGLKQTTVTGTYGPEDYGEIRKTLTLRRNLNVTSIDNIDNDGDTLSSADFALDQELGIIYTLGGVRFSSRQRSVDVTYVAGFAESGSGDARELDVPLDMKNAVTKQFQFEFGRLRVAGGGFGISAFSETEGQASTFTTTDNNGFIPIVTAVVNSYRRRRGII